MLKNNYLQNLWFLLHVTKDFKDIMRKEECVIFVQSESDVYTNPAQDDTKAIGIHTYKK